jgi:hypothetical protein
MAFARKSDNSDLYIYECDVNGKFALACHWCRILRDKDRQAYDWGSGKSVYIAKSVKEMLSHIDEHKKRGDKVIDGLSEYIEGVYNNDPEYLGREDEEAVKFMQDIFGEK